MGYTGAELRPWFGRKPSDRALRGMARLGAVEGREVAQENTPVETGNLRESWTLTTVTRTATVAGVGWECSWENHEDYAKFVDEGTGLYGPEGRPYLILPKKPGGVLHWVDAATGGDVFATVVLHPGSPGNHMTAISANVVESTVDKWSRPLVRQWAREAERQGDVVA